MEANHLHLNHLFVEQLFF